MSYTKVTCTFLFVSVFFIVPNITFIVPIKNISKGNIMDIIPIGFSLFTIPYLNESVSYLDQLDLFGKTRLLKSCGKNLK